MREPSPNPNTITDYAGTVHFALMGAVMPMANFTFTAADMGSKTFSYLVLNPAGDYPRTAADLPAPSLMGSVAFSVT